jgi:hypothetical protein
MFTSRLRAIARTAAGTTLMAATLGASALGVAGLANAAPDTTFKAGGNVCYSYDYGSQVFYDCD